MHKKMFAVLLASAALLFSGCGNSNSDCRVAVQENMDQGNFDGAISLLEGSCSAQYSTSDLNLNLALAYMGKSGYGVSDVVKIVLDANNNTSNTTFTSFLSSISAAQKTDATRYLNRAQNYFVKSLDPNATQTIGQLCANAATSTDSRVQNVCLYAGFNDTILTTTTITALTGNVDAVVNAINNTSTVPLDMQASLDALQYAALGAGSYAGPGTITTSNVTISGHAYTDMNVTENNGTSYTFYRLADGNSTVVTSGYCTVDGNTSACAGIENTDGSIDTTNSAAASCYACPITLDGNTSASVAQLLVDSLNNGASVITNLTTDQSIIDSVNNFRLDITGSVDGNITVDNIINYLNGSVTQ